MPTVASKSALVKRALRATANPWVSSKCISSELKTHVSLSKQYRAAVATLKTCTISGASSPHICKPRTSFVFAQTTNFIKTRSGSPERVAFSGLKFAVKMSISPYCCTACANHQNVSKTLICTIH